MSASAPAHTRPLGALGGELAQVNGPLLGALVAASLIASAGWPLATYSVTLAVFGGAHVLSELRYVDGRFGAALGRRLRWGLLVLLLGIAGLRVAGLGDWLGWELRATGELALGLGLVGLAAPAALRAGALSGSILAGVGGALGLGMALAPAWAFLALSVLHNLTPLGFLAERLSGRARTLALGVGGLLFVAVPLLIAAGLPMLALGGLAAPDWSPLPTGPLARHLGTYLPRSWHGAPWAASAFGGVVFAQCMHYIAVIYLLPTLGGAAPGEASAPIVPWPRPRVFWSWVVAATLPLLGLYLSDFSEARAVYAVAASIHAWIEIPILLLALSAFGARRP